MLLNYIPSIDEDHTQEAFRMGSEPVMGYMPNRLLKMIGKAEKFCNSWM